MAGGRQQDDLLKRSAPPSPAVVLSEATLAELSRMAHNHLRRTANQSQAEGRTASRGRFFPPDPLSISGRRRQRNLERHPKTLLAFLNALGAKPHQHVVYHSVQDNVNGNCYHPGLLIGLRPSVRDTFAAVNPSSTACPLKVAVETGLGTTPLHLHILCRGDVALPRVIPVRDQQRRMLAVFVRPRKGKGPRSALEDVLYLMKAGHKGGASFDRALPPDDPDQPLPFRNAFTALEEGRRLAQQMGLRRLPKRHFYLNVPRLTSEQIDAACQFLLDQSKVPLPACTALTWSEFTAINSKLERGAQTPMAQLRLFAGFNVIVRAQANGLSLRSAYDQARAARKPNRPFPSYETVTRYAKRWSAELAAAICKLQARKRVREHPLAALISALKR